MGMSKRLLFGNNPAHMTRDELGGAARQLSSNHFDSAAAT
jgi:hypothetical protein